MIDAVLRVRLPCSWVTELTSEHGATVNLVEQKPVADGVVQSLVEIDPGHSEPREILNTLRRNRYVARVEGTVRPKGKIVATVEVKECHACFALAESGCFLTEATATEEGGLEWHLISSDQPTIEQLVKTLQARGLSVDVEAIRTVLGSGALTDRQDRVLSLAYKLGYFEFPKKISLTELAKKLRISKSTLSEILRMGEQKVLHSYFQGLMERAR